jgi:hypothetical protein
LKYFSYLTGPFLKEFSIFFDIPSLAAVIDFEKTALYELLLFCYAIPEGVLD